MLNVHDLHIEEEIRPLFDFTCNNHAGNELRDIVSKTLNSKEEILFRQQVLKGFIAHWELVKDYSHYRFNLSEIYDFSDHIYAVRFNKEPPAKIYVFGKGKTAKKRKADIVGTPFLCY